MKPFSISPALLLRSDPYETASTRNRAHTHTVTWLRPDALDFKSFQSLVAFMDVEYHVASLPDKRNDLLLLPISYLANGFAVTGCYAFPIAPRAIWRKFRFGRRNGAAGGRDVGCFGCLVHYVSAMLRWTILRIRNIYFFAKCFFS